MKQIIIFSSLLTVLSCNRDPHLSNISSLPAFSIMLVDSTTLFYSKSIPLGKPVIIIYFRPDCPHSQIETKNLIQDITKFQDCNMIFIAAAPLQDTRSYACRFHLDRYPKIITIGNDYEHAFSKRYQIRSVPFLVIYDQNQELSKIYHGEVPIDHILTALHS